MSQSTPSLAFKLEVPSGETPKATPHLLPCRVHHSGPFEPVQAFWDPKPGESENSHSPSHLKRTLLTDFVAVSYVDGTNTAYFRGRKLQGTTVKLPEGYRGVVAVTSAAEEPSRRPDEVGVVDLEAEMPQGTLQTQAAFDEMVVWGHEAAVDAAADPYLRGAEEWLALADKVRRPVVCPRCLCLLLMSRTDPLVSLDLVQGKMR